MNSALSASTTGEAATAETTIAYHLTSEHLTNRWRRQSQIGYCASSPPTSAQMAESEATEELAIIVKAVPQPSKRYGETVCCAGITRQGEWRRLYPIRFRRLKDNSFARWQWIECRTARRRSDLRAESRRVSEDSIKPLSTIK